MIHGAVKLAAVEKEKLTLVEHLDGSAGLRDKDGLTHTIIEARAPYEPQLSSKNSVAPDESASRAKTDRRRKS